MDRNNFKKLLIYKQNIKKINAMQKKLFSYKVKKLKTDEVRKHHILVSLSEKDLDTAKKIKAKKESFAAHVYKFYIRGIQNFKKE